MLDSTFKFGGQVLSRVEGTDYSRATTVVHKHEYPLTLSLVGIGQMSRLNDRCLPITVEL